MDKSAIKSFAIEARKILMKSAITQAGFYGVSKDGCDQPTQKGAGFEVYRTIAGTDNRIFGDDIKRREKLVRAVEEKGFDQVIEETAYTWFNRLIAIRFMEVNGYLPTRTRVLSSETGSNTPDLMSQYMDVDLNMTMDELEKVQTLVRENRYDDAFALLFVKQCNALNDILPELFEKTTDYMELLLKLSYTSDGVVRMIVDTIPESNFDIEQEGQIEIIGWMYQYYNTELKDDTFALLKKNVKITKERIPSATQLFTPDWIVRYMVENSLGRLWVEGHPDEVLKANWKYYLEEAEQEADVQVQLEEIRKEYRDLNPEDIKVIDPCMGSGHILVYCFDVLMQIYESQGYSQRDAARLILENNLYGLDIDKRAAQLAYFAVMMKARQYDRRIFARNINPHVYAIEESNNVNRNQLKYFGKNLNPVELNKAKLQIIGLLDDLRNAKEFGSILQVNNYDWDLLYNFVNNLNDDGQMTFETIGLDNTKDMLSNLIELAELFAQKYDVVITNPPYIGINNMGGEFYDYIVDKHEAYKHDLYCVFIDVCRRMLKANRFQAMITQQSFMFNSRYEKARKSIITQSVCMNLLHLGARAFEEIGGEVVQTVAFVFNSGNIKHYSAKFFDLQGGASQYEKEELYLKSKKEQHCKIVYENYLENFEQIGGCNYSYWLSERTLYTLANNKKISSIAVPRHGLVTGDGSKFMRLWTEVSGELLGNNSLGNYKEQYKWFPYTKGGTMRRWYGNREYVVNWEKNGIEIRNFKDKSGKIKSSNYNLDYNFQENISWSDLTTGLFSGRYTPEGSLFDTSGPALFLKEKDKKEYLLAFMNTKVMQLFLNIFCTGLHYSSGSVGNIPFIFDQAMEEEIKILSSECVNISKEDWDSFEMSWDYKEHPFVRISKGLWDVTATRAAMKYYYGEHLTVSCPLEMCYMLWQGECNERYNKLKTNEEQLNRIFIDIYGLQKEVQAEVIDKEITVRKADLAREIRSLVSYAVGCMFGRYSMDIPGVVYSGGKWKRENYISFIPDKDNCIPITDEEYFDDDIVGQFVFWMQMAFGREHLEANLDFIARALGNKGTTPRDVIRNYFLNDFFKDHCATYMATGSGKRPIYWMFDSGKQNGFKCLIYMHRYDRDTVGRVRSDYLRKSQEAIEAALKNAEYTIQNSTSAIDKATATKKRDKYIKQLSEIRTYFQALSHVALQRIDIDLDDGVKVNYEKFQNIEIVDENGKKQKINLLAKI